MDISRQQLLAAFKASPRPIREYVASDALGDFAQKLGLQHGLHVDTVGELAKQTGYLLVGLMNPVAFKQELAAMGLTDSEAGAIIQELNEQVFKPLQDAVRNAPAEDRPAAPSAAIPAPAQPARPVAVPRPAIPPPAVSFNPPPVPAAPGPRPEPSLPAATKGAPPANLPGADVGLPVEPTPFMRTMQSDFPGGKPAASAVSAPVPTPKPAPIAFNVTPPAPPVPAAPVPRPIAPPKAPTPAVPAMPAVQRPIQPPIARPVVPAPQTHAPKPLASPLKGGYGVDPYREPIE
jgi:hypothetical protein